MKISTKKSKEQQEKQSYNDSTRFQYNITINWIRHGESCANYLTGKIKDKKSTPEAKLGYGINENEYETDSKDNIEFKDELKNNDEEDWKDELKNSSEEDWEDNLVGEYVGDYVWDEEALDKIERQITTTPDTNQWSSWLGFTSNNEKPEKSVEKSDEKSKISSTVSWITNNYKYEPNLTYIGMNHSINLGTEFFSLREHNNPKNIYISSALTRTITTALLALRFIPNAVIYVVPYINELENGWNITHGDKQNLAVESSKLIKKIMFIKDWLEKNWIIKFDDIEVINFLIAIYEIINTRVMHTNGHQDPGIIKENIKKVLDCRKNRTCRNEYIDNVQNLVLEIIENENIRNGTYFKWGENNEIRATDIVKYNFVISTINKVKQLLEDRQNIRGPIVNFEIYNHFEGLFNDKIVDIPDTKYSNSEFFLNNVLKIIHNDIIFNEEDGRYPEELTRSKQVNTEDIKIYAFIHGSLIRKIWEQNKIDTYNQNLHELENMMNTTVVSNTITFGQLHRIINHDFEIIHRPTKIRSSYYNFENYNADVCKLQSIKGIINYPLGDPQGELDRERYIPTEDVKFFYEEGKNYNDLPLQIKQKYLKYKKKYLNLKNTKF